MPTKPTSYSTSLTDAEWQLLAPLLPAAGKLGRPPRYRRRAVLDAIFYVLRSGGGWRLLPHDLPPWRLCYYYWAKWRDQGVWARVHEALRQRARARAGKKKPRKLRSSTARALRALGTAECADAMAAKRSWEESGIWRSIAWALSSRSR